jgi:predicted permease
MANLKLAIRVLLKSPVVSAVAIVSLALGIGANAAIFSLTNQILLRPLPVPAPETLVNLEAPGPKPGSTSCNQAGGCDEVFSYAMFRDLEREQTALEGLAAHRTFGLAVSRGTQTFNGQGAMVSGSYFPLLGLAPARGALFGREVDQTVGGHPVVVLGHEFWALRLGADPSVVGGTMLVNGTPMTVAGIAPEGFEGTTLGVRPMVYVPLTMRAAVESFAGDGQFDDRRAYWLYVFGRLRPGGTLEAARAQMEPLYRAILQDVEAPLQEEISAQTLEQFVARPLPVVDGRRGQSGMDENAGTPLWLLFGVTGVVVLIACANIANLLLARAAGRTQEMAVRLSVGAHPRHLLTQLLTESCVLALAGGVAALAVARLTLTGVASLLPPIVRDVLRPELDPTAVALTLGLALVTGLVFGLVPALQSTRRGVVTALKDQAGQPAGARGAARFRTGLVVAQVALSTALLAVAGLFVQSLANIGRTDLGIVTEDVVTFRLSPALIGYDDPRARDLFRRTEEALGAQPGVTSTTAAMVPVLGGSNWGTSIMVEGFEAGPDTDRNTRFNFVSTGFFETLGVPLLAGRAFADTDADGAPLVAVVNETFAEKFGLGRDVVGRRLGQGGLDTELDIEIVGVVPDFAYSEVKDPVPPMLYRPYRQADNLGTLVFYARTATAPDVLLRAAPALVAQLDATLPVEDLKTLPQQVRENVFLDRLLSLLSAAFAALATILAAVGLYGVLAYTVAQRTREFGLRMALGADAGRVRALVLSHVGRIAGVGAVAGLLGAVWLGRVAESLLFEMEGLQPLVLLAAVAGLALVALAAGYVPAWRASRIDPMVALRDQ